jgi:hypothetical protein
MAPPQFPAPLPGPSPKGRGSALTPVFGAGASADPGFWASLRTPTQLGLFRRALLVLCVFPVMIGVLVPFIVREGSGRFGEVPWWTFLPQVAAAVPAVLVAPRSPRPLSPGPDDLGSAERALGVFRQAVMLRFAFTEAVILAGLPMSVIARSELPFVLGFVLGYPLLLRLALPTGGTVERIRARLESRGAVSHLWAALLSPARRS